MKKNNLDEMQEQKLLKIEHRGMWLAFWGLFAAIILQVLIGIDSPLQLAGEFILLMILSFYILIACLRQGIWDRHLKANFKTNLVVSLITGTAVAIFNIITIYRVTHNLIFLSGIIFGSCTFILTFLLLQLCAFLYKKRLNKLENE